MDKRDSFVFYTDSLDILDDLSGEQVKNLMIAIREYQRGNNPEMDNITKIAFASFKRDLDKNAEKWEETKRKRSEAGKIGMRNRWNNQRNNAKNQEITKKENNNDNNVITKITNDNNVINDITKITDNVNVNVNVNDNVNINNNSNSSLLLVLQPTQASENPKDIDIKKFIDYYNKSIIEKNAKIATAKMVALEKRKKQIVNLLKKQNLQKSDLQQIIEKAIASDFLNFQCTTRIDFDWIFNSNNAIKILEGRYDNKKLAPKIQETESVVEYGLRKQKEYYDYFAKKSDNNVETTQIITPFTKSITSDSYSDNNNYVDYE